MFKKITLSILCPFMAVVSAFPQTVIADDEQLSEKKSAYEDMLVKLKLAKTSLNNTRKKNAETSDPTVNQVLNSENQHYLLTILNTIISYLSYAQVKITSIEILDQEIKTDTQNKIITDLEYFQSLRANLADSKNFEELEYYLPPIQARWQAAVNYLQIAALWAQQAQCHIYLNNLIEFKNLLNDKFIGNWTIPADESAKQVRSLNRHLEIIIGQIGDSLENNRSLLENIAIANESVSNNVAELHKSFEALGATFATEFKLLRSLVVSSIN